MTIQHIKTIAVVLFFLAGSFRASAQEFSENKNPVAVLVQLKSEKRRIEALIRSKRMNELERFRKEAYQCMMATVADFRDHFSARPVYFYIDTNFDAIQQRKFEGVLLDNDLRIATNINIKPDNYFLIANYGTAQWQTSKRGWDTTRSKYDGGQPSGKILVINDPQMRQVTYVRTLDFDFFNFKRQDKKNPYRFRSRKYNIEYYPSAAEFDRRLKKHLKSM
jgi:hypothetical protein